MDLEAVHRRNQLFGNVATLPNTANDELPFIALESSNCRYRRVEAAPGNRIRLIESS